jgi:hypothetical protein
MTPALSRNLPLATIHSMILERAAASTVDSSNISRQTVQNEWSQLSRKTKNPESAEFEGQLSWELVHG